MKKKITVLIFARKWKKSKKSKMGPENEKNEKKNRFSSFFGEKILQICVFLISCQFLKSYFVYKIYKNLIIGRENKQKKKPKFWFLPEFSYFFSFFFSKKCLNLNLCKKWKFYNHAFPGKSQKRQFFCIFLPNILQKKSFFSLNSGKIEKK